MPVTGPSRSESQCRAQCPPASHGQSHGGRRRRAGPTGRRAALRLPAAPSQPGPVAHWQPDSESHESPADRRRPGRRDPGRDSKPSTVTDSDCVQVASASEGSVSLSLEGRAPTVTGHVVSESLSRRTATVELPGQPGLRPEWRPSPALATVTLACLRVGSATPGPTRRTVGVRPGAGDWHEPESL